MESVSVKVLNPFALKESLLVALEVAWPDMDREAVSAVRGFLSHVPSSVRPAEIAVGQSEREGLLACSAYFQRSRTWHWMREDLVQALYDLFVELKRKG